MPEIVRNDIDNLNAKLVLNLKKEDYEPKLKSELNKYRAKAQMKGFRKGKTPIGLIKKMYGRAILVDVINGMVQDEVFTYIKENNIQTLGQPLPSEDQPEYEFDVNALEEMSFHFDLGIAPEVALKGLDGDSDFEVYKVEIPDAFLDKEIETARTRVGERGTVEDQIQEEDVVKLNVEELDGDALKENGWAASFSVFVKDIAEEEVKNEFMTKKAGDKIRVNVFTLEKDKTADFVRKHMLSVGENDEEVVIGEMFEATIEEVNRIQPAELNQEFFDKYMGPGKASSVEDMKNIIRDDYVKHYDKQAESLMFRDFNDMLLEKNDMDLPKEFLKRWLVASEENNSMEDVEKGFEGFSKSLKWSLIRGELIKKFDLEVGDEELFEGMKNKVRGLFMQYGQAEVDELIILNTANRMIENEEQANEVYGELMNEKVFKTIKEQVKISEKAISQEDFDALLKAEREKYEKEQAESMAQQVIEDTAEDTPAGDETDEEVTESVEEL